MIELPYEGAPVPIVHNPTRDEFLRRVAAADGPFKVTGAIHHWRLARVLAKLGEPVDQIDYLAGLLNDRRVGFTVAPPEQKGSFRLTEDLKQNFSLRARSEPFFRFADELKAYLFDPSRGTLYLQSTPLPTLASQLGALELFEGFYPVTAPRFWIGSGQQKVALHNDPARNIIAIFAGRKRAILAPPEELPNLYPAPFDRRLAGTVTTLVDVYEPDFDRYPRFRDAVKSFRVTTIEPGEFLYLPPLWWHALESDIFNVGLNCWFVDDGPKRKVVRLYSPGANLLRELSTLDEGERRGIRDCFRAALDGETAEAEPAKGLGKHRKLATKATKLGHLLRGYLDESELSEPQRALWLRWAHQFTDWYIFCVMGEPFPTLEAGEHGRMARRVDPRFSLSKTMQSLGTAAVRAFFVIEPTIRKLRAHEHHLVPLEGRAEPRIECGRSILVEVNGREGAVVVSNYSVGGLFIRNADPPAIGTRVKVRVGRDDADTALDAVVVWRREGEGYGLRFVDERHHTEAFIRELEMVTNI